MSIADSELYGTEPINRDEVERRLELTADWRLPSKRELRAFKEHHRLRDMADDLIAAADIHDESWILLERMWSGFPDPPPFVFIAFRSNGSQVCAADLDGLSPSWRLPDGVPFKYSPDKST